MDVKTSISSGVMVFNFELGLIILNVYTGRVTEKIGVSPKEETEALLYYYSWLCDWYDAIIGEEEAA